MSTFSAMDIGRSGAGFADYWVDTVAHNIANANTVNPAGEEPFRARMVVAQEVADGDQLGGAAVGDVVEDATDPARVFDPSHPYADADGYVTMPVVDLAGQMSDLMLAQRTYQVNLQTIQTGREAYQSALRIGQ